MGNRFTVLDVHIDTEAGLEIAAKGGNTKQIAEAMGFGVRELHRYKIKYPDFAMSLKQARADGWILLGEGLLTIAEDNPFMDILDLRLKSENTRWVLSKLHNSVFGDKLALQVEHVDILGALSDAKSRVARVVNPVELLPPIDPFT